jgi:hypothetical protein
VLNYGADWLILRSATTQMRPTPNRVRNRCRRLTGHSAHVGQEVEVYYRWHAFYGRRIWRQFTERRGGNVVVHVAVAPGVVIRLAAWMLDSAVCAGMTFGAPCVTVSALAELHQLLTERGFRQSSLGDPTIVQEQQYVEPTDAGAVIGGPAPAQHSVRFGKASSDGRVGAPHRAPPAGQPPICSDAQ